MPKIIALTQHGKYAIGVRTQIWCLYISMLLTEKRKSEAIMHMAMLNTNNNDDNTNAVSTWSFNHNLKYLVFRYSSEKLLRHVYLLTVLN